MLLDRYPTSREGEGAPPWIIRLDELWTLCALSGEVGWREEHCARPRHRGPEGDRRL